MPQLRWTLLGLGVLFIILLVWIERRRQRRLFTDSGSEKDTTVQGGPASFSASSSTFREPVLTLPEMRARDPSPSHELPVVEIEEDSLTARHAESDAAPPEPPTLSLPVMSSGLVARRQSEPRVSDLDLADSGRFAIGEVPRLDTPARADSPQGEGFPEGQDSRGRPRVAPKIDLAGSVLDRANRADKDEKSFNDEVFGNTAEDSENAAEDSEPWTDAGPRAAAGEPHIVEIEAEYTAAPPRSEQIRATDLNPDDPDIAEEDTSGDTSSTEPAAEASQPHFTMDDIAPMAEPIVEWPPDDQRRIVALRLVAPPTERIAGRTLRLALASEGFVLGKFSIFHKPDDSGRAVLSAASLSKPGTFDIETMDVARYGGLSLFAVLPGPKPPLKAFEDLLATARNLNDRLQGALQDERGGPLTPMRIASLREALSAEVS
ncbi:MAG TPA: cell division protein ZipA C-terminal FtsZ-binding domain-containing protein [Steroidobacteraceae bacterium]|nr:cell division protein ZipA C-terminal FtsZ-binding domain-containing protein [Steroidobacteraceae bacterium]